MAKHHHKPHRSNRPLHPHEYKSPHQIAFEIAYVRPAITPVFPACPQMPSGGGTTN